MESRNFVTVLQESPLIPIMRQMNSVCNLPSYFYEVHFDIVVHSMLESLKYFFRSAFLFKIVFVQ